ncbi:MAG: hypothetical protein QM500_13730 [Methylococcales bacterium]
MIKFLPINWSYLGLVAFIIWIFVYSITGENVFSYFLNQIVNNYYKIDFILSIIAIIIIIIVINRVKYNEIEDWLEQHSLKFYDIKAKHLFSDKYFFTNMTKVQYIVTATDSANKKNEYLFQFGFRNFTNPKVVKIKYKGQSKGI